MSTRDESEGYERCSTVLKCARPEGISTRTTVGLDQPNTAAMRNTSEFREQGTITKQALIGPRGDMRWFGAAGIRSDRRDRGRGSWGGEAEGGDGGREGSEFDRILAYEPARRAAREVRRQLSLRQKLADGAVVSRFVRALAGAVGMVGLGKRARARMVAPTRQCVQSRAAERDRRVQADQCRDQDVAEGSNHGRRGKYPVSRLREYHRILNHQSSKIYDRCQP